ncbi:hypothetical protein BB559_003550 [Furculomyces boomerangus]|uniref:Large ribosomal subunit protein bL28m n=2 Tax=Harpellales TaxID=61421 RepID=A0A2T9XZD0_9FUNG|nr:hypothetical protein BB559_007049 [Furculomyces boomerangus]PVU85669.1 hypothetical protein BB559_006881 [Furculomyces boomerangus]PVU92904.1 hypothetical protein BB559_003550 [Furculomyces boomerangus]PVZ98014.1 hypothetical protein BB558_005991 [Smittium angustum]
MKTIQRALQLRNVRKWQVDGEGLLGGKTVKFGNNKPKSNYKTHRLWLPNIQFVNLYSEILDKSMKLKVVTSVLRTIDKKGGLDNYLLNTKDKNIASKTGLELKSVILAKLKEKQQQQA